MSESITVTFTQEDLDKAEAYTSCRDCLLATALKRIGYRAISVGGAGDLSIGGRDFEPTTPFSAREIEHEDEAVYRQDVVGKTWVFEEVRGDEE